MITFHAGPEEFRKGNAAGTQRQRVRQARRPLCVLSLSHSLSLLVSLYLTQVALCGSKSSTSPLSTQAL